MYTFLNLSQSPDILEAFLKANNFSEEEEKYYKKMLEENSSNIGINIFDLIKNK